MGGGKEVFLKCLERGEELKNWKEEKENEGARWKS